MDSKLKIVYEYTRMYKYVLYIVNKLHKLCRKKVTYVNLRQLERLVGDEIHTVHVVLVIIAPGLY